MKRSVRKDCTSGRNLLMKYVPLELKKGLSVFLSILLLGTILPASSMAASIPSRSLRPIPYSPPPCESIRTAQKEAEANPEEAKKPKELVNKRTKNSKKYIYSSGIYSSKTYPRAIHKKNDKGGWEDIDENITKPLSFLTKFATWQMNKHNQALLLYIPRHKVEPLHHCPCVFMQEDRPLIKMELNRMNRCLCPITQWGDRHSQMIHICDIPILEI